MDFTRFFAEIAAALWAVQTGFWNMASAVAHGSGILGKPHLCGVWSRGYCLSCHAKAYGYPGWTLKIE